MFKELFTESSQDIMIKVGLSYNTNNGFVVRITKDGGLRSMGMRMFDGEIIDGPNKKMFGKIKRYTLYGLPTGFQKQSEKHTDAWTISSIHKG